MNIHVPLDRLPLCIPAQLLDLISLFSHSKQIVFLYCLVGSNSERKLGAVTPTGQRTKP